ncbi:MAG: cupin domain-containing protein [Pseudomonadota bacterium]
MSDLEQINQILNAALANAQDPVRDTETRTRKVRMLANIKKRTTAAAPEGTMTLGPEDVPWEPFDTGIERQLLTADPKDGTETAIYRLQPGARFVEHEHTHQETCWVVQGELLIGDHLVRPGQMHVAEIGHAHPEIIARTEALLLIRSQTYVGPLTPNNSP